MDPRSEGRIKLKCNQERVERYLEALEIKGVCCSDDNREFFVKKNVYLRAKIEKLAVLM